MEKNMGIIDRISRVIIAVILGVLVWQGSIESPWSYIAIIIAGVFLLTSLVSFCPLYRLINIDTCPTK